MKKFEDLAISEPVMRALSELGFNEPTPIQAETLPLLLGEDSDFLGLAATGTGKTAAFGIPLLERIDTDEKSVQALILCPTRELAMQVAGQIDLLGKYLGVRSLAVYGGTGYGDQIYGLKRGAQIVIGTPGRVVDHLDKGTLNLKNLKTLVLDEADEMISMGFKEDLEKVLQSAPKDQANIWLFSATMAGDVRRVADEYLRNPKKVQVNRTEMLPNTVEQIFYRVHEYDKPDVLCKLIEAADDFYGIVFCQTKALAADLNHYMTAKGYRVDSLHGDLDQTARDRVMQAFRDRKISVLIATDVACRGLDVKDITHVVNYSIPRELDNYVHRIGRTGRMGKTGFAMSLVTNSHRELVGKIERMTKTKIKEGVIPSQREVLAKKLKNVETAFLAQEKVGKMQSLLTDSWKKELAAKTPEEIAARFLTLMFPQILETTPERLPGKPQDDSRDRGSRGGDRGGRGRDGGRGRGRDSRGGGGGYRDRARGFRGPGGGPRRENREPRERSEESAGEFRPSREARDFSGKGSREEKREKFQSRWKASRDFHKQGAAAPAAAGGAAPFKKKKKFGKPLNKREPSGPSEG